jgi:hypothetical protein
LGTTVTPPVQLVLARLLSGEPVASLLPDVSDVGLQRTLLAVVSREGLYEPDASATAALQIVARLARPAWRARLAALTAEIERCATRADVEGLRAAATEKSALLARERALEKALFAQGRAAYMLDGSNVLLGVDSDLHFRDATQIELVRRFGEVAHILLDAGLLVVSTTNAIGLADYGAVRALIPDTPSIVVEVDPAGESLAPCDLRIRGSEPEADVIARIAEILAARQITAV